ncbi:MAG: M16 family metallopeptidase [Phycisphaerae bacterium]
MSAKLTSQTLDNGLRVVVETMPDVSSAAVGFLVDTGARDEVSEQAGVSHFLEHMMFKGTPRRDWSQITIDFDRMGSTYNAYTSVDRTVYYGWVRKNDLGQQVELLADMLQSTIPQEEFDKEKQVVLEEIAMAKDSLDHVAFDFLQEKVFSGHPLSWPILGYDQTVSDLERDTMFAYFQRRYVPKNMVMVATGAVDPDELFGLANEHCGSWTGQDDGHERKQPVMHAGSDTLQLERFNQQLLALSFPAVGAADPLAETAGAAATILGGDNSRFYWNIVQEGIAPRAGAFHFDFSDCGLMLLYGSTQPENAEQLLDAIRQEADRICKEPVKPDELERVKNKRRTGLAMESEAPYQRLTQIMDDMQYRGTPRSVDQMLADVEAITIEGVSEYWQQYPINTGGHLTSAGPRDWPTSN